MNETVRIGSGWVEASVRGRDYTPAYVTIRSGKPVRLELEFAQAGKIEVETKVRECDQPAAAAACRVKE